MAIAVRNASPVLIVEFPGVCGQIQPAARHGFKRRHLAQEAAIRAMELQRAARSPIAVLMAEENTLFFLDGGPSKA